MLPQLWPQLLGRKHRRVCSTIKELNLVGAVKRGTSRRKEQERVPFHSGISVKPPHQLAAARHVLLD